MLTGFPANSVFIVDSKDRVRHHTVLDPRFLVMMLMYNVVDVDPLVGTGVNFDQSQGWMEPAGGRKVGFRLQVCPVLLLLKCILPLFCAHNFHLNKSYTTCSHFWFRSTDGGQGLAMSCWQSMKDTVENKVNSCNVLFGVNVVDLLPDPCHRQLLHNRVWGRGGRQRHLCSNAVQGQTRCGQTSWMEGH